MRLQFQCAVPAGRAKVWELLQDMGHAALCIPGVEGVQPQGDDTYAGTMRVRLGAVSLTLEGRLTLQQRDDARQRMVMAVEGRERRVGGAVQGTITLELGEPAPGHTALGIQADLAFLGKLGELGQSVIRHKAEATLREFAQAVGQQAGG
ncbi:MAG: SRPBCC family protein [Chloroflexi bacterium]|nr:SRPBCC family protein [Chloroflexota bacterium]